MAAAELNLTEKNTIYKGADFKRSMLFTVPNPDYGVVVGAPERIPMDLTGYEFFAMLKAYTNDGLKEVAQFVCTLDADPTTGRLTIFIPRTATILLETSGKEYKQVTRYVWDLYMQDTDNLVSRIFNGYADVSPRVTQVEQYGN